MAIYLSTNLRAFSVLCIQQRRRRVSTLSFNHVILDRSGVSSGRLIVSRQAIDQIPAFFSTTSTQGSVISYMSTPATAQPNTTSLKALVSLVIAVLVSSVLYLANIEKIHPSLTPFMANFDKTASLSFLGNEFDPVGNIRGGIQGTSALVNQLENGQLQLSKKVDFRALNYPFIEYQLSPLFSGLRVYLYWRNSKNPDVVHNIQLPLSTLKVNMLNLSSEPGWTQEIIELSIFAQGELRNTAFRLEKITFVPATKKNILKLILSDTLSLRTWTQASINAVQATPKGSLISPVLIFSIWVGLSIIIFALLSFIFSTFRRDTISKDILVFAGITFLLGWVALDLIWTRRILFQSEQTGLLFAGKSMHEKKMVDIDGGIYRDALKIKELLHKPSPIIWLVTRDAGTFQVNRLKYHLTPYPVYYPTKSNDESLYRLMRRFGIARENQLILMTKPLPKRSGFDEKKGLFKLVAYCAAAKLIYESDRSLLLELRKDLEKCS